MRFGPISILFVASIGLQAISAPRPCSAEPVEWSGLRVGCTPERTRIVFEFASPAFEVGVSTADSIVTVDLRNVRPVAGSQFVLTPVGRLVAFSWGPATHGVAVRIVAEPGSTSRSFVLARDREIPDRLVIDLSGSSLPTDFRREASRKQGVGPGQVGGGTGAEAPPRVVVIDAGHGGDDPGAIAGGLREKDVAFDIAKRLHGLLSRDPALHVLLTRSDDTRIPLRRRMRSAEEAGADLFVSIHLNAARDRKASGAEVFFLSIGAATDEAAKEVARLENEVDPELVVEEDESLQGLPFSVDLRQSDTLRRSSRAAELLLDVLTDRNLADARGVKQAGFAVLKSFQVPSVLVEVGFISSPADRAHLETPEHKQRLADALCSGIRIYFEQYAPHRSSVREP